MKICNNKDLIKGRNNFLNKKLLFYLGLISLASKVSLTTTTHLPFDKERFETGNSGDADENFIEDFKEIVGSQNADPADLDSSQRVPRFQGNCDRDDLLRIEAYFPEHFVGRIYAYDYADEKLCGFSSDGRSSKNVSIELPYGQCGIQMVTINDKNDVEMFRRFEVTLYIQYSLYLQQIIDERITVPCLTVKKSLDDDSLQNIEEEELMEEEKPVNSRQGRKLKGEPTIKRFKPTMNEKAEKPKIGESWMEIISGKDPKPKSKKITPISVGEDITLVVSTRVQRGYDARIVNCSAHDGSRDAHDGYRIQQILDSAGCSIDKSLVPNFRRRRLPVESRNNIMTLHFSTFQAFKFPERDHIHFRCNVAYCQGPCPQEICDSGLNHFGSWKDKYGRIAEALVETTEVVNSIEVLAPDLEANSGGHHYEKHQSGIDSGTGTTSTSTSSSTARQFSDSSSRQQFHQQPQPYSSSSSSASTPTSSSSSRHNGATAGSNRNGRIYHEGAQGSLCVSPSTVIFSLVILGVLLVISATVILWFSLKGSEEKKYRQNYNPSKQNTLFHHQSPNSYYRFSHW